MNKMLYCPECDIEFRVKYDGDEGLFIPTWCTFCGTELNPDEQYSIEEDADEA